jgi:chromosome segregation ATPase
MISPAKLERRVGFDSTLKGWCAMAGRRFFSAAALAVSLILVGVAVSAQAERRAATLDDLLTEMRGLRADLAQTANTSMRMQVLTARLTLQEQRIAVLSNQRAELLARLAAAERERVEIETRVKGLQDDSQRVKPEMREEVEGALKAETTRLSQRVQFEQQLRSQETDLTGLIASEQGRWQEFNGRLDELEKSLPAARPR